MKHLALAAILAGVLAPTALACSSSGTIEEVKRLGVQSQCGWNEQPTACYTREVVMFTLRASSGYRQCPKFQWEFDDGVIVPIVAESCDGVWCQYTASRTFFAPGRQRTQPAAYLKDGRRMNPKVTMTFDVIANPDPPPPDPEPEPDRRRAVRSR